MIKKIYTIICNNCGEAINHYPELTKKKIIKQAKKEQIIFFKNNKQFCDEKCYKKYINNKLNLF